MSTFEWVFALGIAPAWMLAGLADFGCHRALRIEQSAGLRESSLHGLMLLELTPLLIVALWLEVNTAALALMLTACVLHEITTWADLAYAESRRPIPWFEQWVHGVQQSLPWAALGLAALTHPAAAFGLVGYEVEPSAWTLRPRTSPMPAAVAIPVLAASAVFAAMPWAAEFVRCWRARATR